MSFLRRLFGKKGWDSYPKAFTNELRGRLGERDFASLDQIARRYSLFKQELMAMLTEPSFLGGDVDMKVTMFSSLLTSLGDELVRRGYGLDRDSTEDAELIFKLVLRLKPSDYSARGSLAFLYYAQGRREAAREEANTALREYDARQERLGHVVPDCIVPRAEMASFKDMLTKLATGGDLE